MPQLPYQRQINEWYCGPAVLQMVLGGFGVRASQERLARMSGTNAKHGTPRAGLVRTLRAEGFRVRARHGRTLTEVEKAVADGKTVVVLYVEKEADEAHYAI